MIVCAWYAISLASPARLFATDTCDDGSGGFVYSQDALYDNTGTYYAQDNSQGWKSSGTFFANYCETGADNLITSAAYNDCYNYSSTWKVVATSTEYYYDGQDIGSIYGTFYCCSRWGLNC